MLQNGLLCDGDRTSPLGCRGGELPVQGASPWPRRHLRAFPSSARRGRSFDLAAPRTGECVSRLRVPCLAASDLCAYPRPGGSVGAVFKDSAGPLVAQSCSGSQGGSLLGGSGWNDGVPLSFQLGQAQYRLAPEKPSCPIPVTEKTSEKPDLTIMISMITEQLQKQSLEDLKCKSFSISLPLPNQTDPEGCSSPFHFVTEERSWGLISHCPRIELEDGIRLGCHHHSSLSLHFPVLSRENSPHRRSPSHAPEAGNSSAPPAPPTKRHCRSLSVPEDLSRWRPVWRPSGSKVWTPVKRRCNSGGVGAVLGVQTQNPTQGVSSLRFQNDPSASIRCIQANSPPFFSLALCRESPGPYTLSPTGVFWENTEGPSCFPLQRRFSLSPVLIKDAGRFLPSTSSSPPSTPELVRRQQCLPRSQSQPCDLDTRKCGIKRRHEEDTRWHRPSLDFYKMNQNAGAMCFLDNSDEGSSSSPFMAYHGDSPCTIASPVTTCTLALSEEDMGRRHSSCPQAMLFQHDFADLDLNLIEEN